MPSLDRLFNGFRAAGTNGRLNFSLFWGNSGNPASLPCIIWLGSRVPRLINEVSLPNGEAQLARYLIGLAGGPLA